MNILHAARLRGEALLAGTMPAAYRAILRTRGKSNAMKVVLAGLVRRGDIVFDVGANQGIFTALMSNLAGRDGRVHAFEPSPETCRLLRATLEARALTPANVVVNAMAAGAEDGTAMLHTPQRELIRHPLFLVGASVDGVPAWLGILLGPSAGRAARAK